jgi:probable FeS assembly SUF system protein SufT
MRHEIATLSREVLATEIPSGTKFILPQGAPVTLMQSLGGSYTVLTDEGRMVRIDGKDGAAMGEKFAPKSEEPLEPSAPDAPFDEEKVWEELRTVYDPEIPVNIVDLGLVYVCNAVALPEGGRRVEIKMTMTAPGCGMGDVLMQDVRKKVMAVPGVKEADVEVVWEPAWDASRMSDAARLQLGWM